MKRYDLGSVPIKEFRAVGFLIIIVLALACTDRAGSGAKAKTIKTSSVNGDRDLGDANFSDQKGFNLTSWWAGELSGPQMRTSLGDLRATNANAVMLVVTWYMDHPGANKIFPHPEKSPTMADLRAAIAQIRAQGFHHWNIKIHVDLLDGSWRGAIAPENVAIWFRQYAEYLGQIAQLAEQEDCSLLIIGTEFKSLSDKYAAKWSELISVARTNYSGQLAYASNWDEYRQVVFWSQLDLLGIDGYFPLSNKDNPTIEELTSSWVDWFAAMEQWRAGHGKPLLLTEVGYIPWDEAARTPWLYPRAFNANIQANCYQAVITAARDYPQLYGIYFWNWLPAPVTGAEADNALTYSPQGRPLTLEVLRNW